MTEPEDKARRALAYFQECRPGQRFGALAVLHVAMTGHQLGRGVCFRFDEYEQIPSPLRARVRAALAHGIKREPVDAVRAGMRSLLSRLDDLEARSGRIESEAMRRSALRASANSGKRNARIARMEQKRA